MQLESGSIIAGKYRLERPLSAGGMGSVWVAQHVQLGTHVAVKFMGTAYAGSPAFRARFEREARAAAHLRSPHVVQVHDFGFEQSVPYLVMELLRGEDLSARLSRVRRLSLPETQRLLVQAGKALRSVHDAGLVHRDLKPANLFLARVDGEDEDLLKLIDFGIAKETASKLVTEASTTGEVMGSPHYMSPEQLRADRDIDARSDLWAMGVILFRMVTGYLPFPGDVLAQVMTRILVEPIPSARQLAADLPPALDAFFARAFARDRAHRFQSAREMVEEFGRATGMPVFSSSGVGGSSPFGWTAVGAPGTVPAGAAGGAGAAGAAGPRAPVGAAVPGGSHGAGPQLAAPGQFAGNRHGHAVAAGQEPPPGTLTDAVHVSASPRPRSRRARAAWVAVAAAGLAIVGVGLGVMLRRTLEAPGAAVEASAPADARTGAGTGAAESASATGAAGPAASATAAAAAAPAAGSASAAAPAPSVFAPENDAGASAAPEPTQATAASSGTSASPAASVRPAAPAGSRTVRPQSSKPGKPQPAGSDPYPEEAPKQPDWGIDKL